jgi:hypothetical protein
MYQECSRGQHSVYKGSLPSHVDSSLSNSPCSTFAVSLSLAWLLTCLPHVAQQTLEGMVSNLARHSTRIPFGEVERSLPGLCARGAVLQLQELPHLVACEGLHGGNGEFEGLLVASIALDGAVHTFTALGLHHTFER